MKRNKDESFEDYKIRRAAQNKADRERLKGRIVWSRKDMTYVKSIDGELK